MNRPLKRFTTPRWLGEALNGLPARLRGQLGVLPTRLRAASRGRLQAVLLLTVGLVAGLLAAVAVPRLTGTPARSANTVQDQAVLAPPGVPLVGSGPVMAGYAQPTELRIAAIKVRTRLVDLVLDANGTLTAPTDYQTAGWFAAGPTPGEAGGPPAIIAGHIDSMTGPAVFYRLHQLKRGNIVEVRSLNGTVRHFTVYKLADYAKRAFPAAQVYAPSRHAELRLITCGGRFNRHKASYESNLVAYATLVQAKE